MKKSHDDEMTKMKSSFKDLSQMRDDLESRVEKLEDLSKTMTLRSCAEYSQYGLKTSGAYMIDPDGGLIGQAPFEVYCNFTTGATEVLHDSENETEVEHCHDPGCYQRNVTYISGHSQQPVSMYQITSLIELAAYCEQEIKYDCILAPFDNEDVNFAYWEDSQGETNIYYTGSNYGHHVCDCHFTDEGCLEEETLQTSCNCDANLPIPATDTGTITNMTALPIMKLFFGGLTYELQSGAFQLGRLKCYGDKVVDEGVSCAALKKKGEMASGYYNIKPKDEERPRVVYCDMKSGTYSSVPQVAQLSDVSPLGTILPWVPRPEASLAQEAIPDGWLPCNGTQIEKGPWAGGRTPDLHSMGAFLRGAEEGRVLEMEESMVANHEHEDTGHQHDCTASSTAEPHTHETQDTWAYMGTGQSDSKMASGSNGQYYRNDYTSSSTTASVSTSCSTFSHTSGLGGVSSPTNSGGETRPANMKVLYIMRCW